MLDYLILATTILVFIFVLLLFWVVWWCYTELTNDFNDTEDMLVDLLNMSALDLKAEGTVVTVKLPKRVKKRIDRRDARKAHDEECDR